MHYQCLRACRNMTSWSIPCVELGVFFERPRFVCAAGVLDCIVVKDLEFGSGLREYLARARYIHTFQKLAGAQDFGTVHDFVADLRELFSHSKKSFLVVNFQLSWNYSFFKGVFLCERIHGRMLNKFEYKYVLCRERA